MQTWEIKKPHSLANYKTLNNEELKDAMRAGDDNASAERLRRMRVENEAAEKIDEVKRQLKAEIEKQVELRSK